MTILQLTGSEKIAKKYSIDEIQGASGANYNLFTANITTAGVSLTGADSRVMHNSQYVTENSGTGTIPNGSTSVKITHGLVDVPTRVQITLTTSLGAASEIYVSNKDIDGDGTKFQVDVDVNPTADVSFDWRAVVGEGN